MTIHLIGGGCRSGKSSFAMELALTLGENLLVSAAWALVALYIGFGFFMSRKRKFADLI